MSRRRLSTFIRMEHPLYSVWLNMRDRCRNPKHRSYKIYGGRGIKVCDRWNSFNSFVADMGPRKEGERIDRINNDSGYSPENCRWVSPREQMHNVRYNVNVTYQGETLCAAEWARRCGVSPSTMVWRIKWWGAEKAVSTINRHKERQ